LLLNPDSCSITARIRSGSTPYFAAAAAICAPYGTLFSELRK